MNRSPEGSRGSVRGLLIAVAVLPAVVMAIVVLVRNLASTSSTGIGIAGVVVLGLVGSGLAWTLAGRLGLIDRGAGAAAGGPGGALGPAPADSPAPGPAGGGGGDLAAHDRDVLVAACVELGDVVPSDALRHRVRDVLEQVGVVAVDVERGAAFDPGSARIVDRVPTSDASLSDRVAGTERLGYVDRGRPLREPEVLIYVVEQDADG